MTFKAQGFNATYGNNISADAINEAGDPPPISYPGSRADAPPPL